MASGGGTTTVDVYPPDTFCTISLPGDTNTYEVSVSARYKIWDGIDCSNAAGTTPTTVAYSMGCDWGDFPRTPPNDPPDCIMKLGSAGDPVLVTNGEMFHNNIDFTLPGRGIDIVFERTYSNRLQIPSNSAVSTGSIDKSEGNDAYISRIELGSTASLTMLRDGVPLGYGWTHTYNQHLDILQSGKTIRYVDGKGVIQYFNQYANGNSDTSYTPQYNWINASLEQNADGTYTLSKKGLNYDFDPAGKLIAIRDSYSNSIALNYDQNGQLNEIIDTLGRHINFYYDANDRLIRISSSIGDLVNYEYSQSPAGLLTKATFIDNTFITYEYNDPNDNANLTKITDENGHTYNYEYYADDTVSKVERDNGNEKIIFDSYNVPDGSYPGSVDPPILPDGGLAISKTTVHNSRDRMIKFRYFIESESFEGRDLPLMFEVLGGICSSCSDGAQRYQWYSDGTMMEKINLDNDMNRRTHFSNYDSQGNPGTIVKGYSTAEQQSKTYSYHPVLRTPLTISRPSVLEPEGSKTTIFDYDDDYDTVPNENPSFRISKIIEKGYTKDINGNTYLYEYTTTYYYNSSGQLISIDGPRTDVNDITSSLYFSDSAEEGNNRAQLRSITDPAGNTISYSNYDIYANPGVITDANGVVTTYTYDSKGRVKTINVGGNVHEFFYDNKGILDYLILPEGNIIDYSYDEVDRLVGITRKDSSSTAIESITYTYDTEGNKTSEAYRSGDTNGEIKKETTFDYDFFNRISKIVLNPLDSPPSSEISVQYTNIKNGPPLDETDANTGNTAKEYLYDALLRLIQVKNLPDNIITTYQYDTQDNLTSVTDANGNTTTYTYDDMGRLVSMTSPDRGTTTYVYDPAGNLISKTDANNITVAYVYDALNRLTNVNFPDSSQNITFSYDSASVSNGKGRLTGITDPSGTTTYYYDSRGRVIKEVKVINSVSYTTEYTYDANGNIVRIDYPSNRFVTYTYDGADRVSGVSLKGFTSLGDMQYTISNIAYEPFGGMSSYDYSDGTVTTTMTINRDNRYRITDIYAGSFIDRDYGYDNMENILAITDTLNSSKNQTFGYDNLYRLTTANGVWGTGSFTYDNVGNRLSKTIGANTTTYSYLSNTNKLSYATGAEAATYTYDNTGNITSDGTYTYEYNQSGRLASVKLGSVTEMTNTYDGLGRRVRRVDAAGGRDFIYDIAGNLISEQGSVDTEYVYLNGMPVMEIEGNGEPTPSLCWDFEDSGSCTIGLWQKGQLGYDNTQIITDTAYVISGASSEKMHVDTGYTGRIVTGKLNLTKSQIDSTHRYLDLWVYSEQDGNVEVMVQVYYQSQCGSSEHVTILSPSNAVAGWNHVNADLKTIVEYVENIYSAAYENISIKVENWESNTIWLDDVNLSSSDTSEQVTFLYPDHLGRPLSGNFDYLPFGAIYQGTPETNLRFPGQYADRTDLYQNGFRDYNPRLGRYMEPDPAGQISDVNLYAYVGNNPVVWVDPEGLKIVYGGTLYSKFMIWWNIFKLEMNSPTAKKLISVLEADTQVVTINPTTGENSYDVNTNICNFNFGSKKIYSGEKQWHLRPPEIGLAHELIHALHDLRGTLGSSRMDEENKTVGVFPYSKNPITENKIRKEYGLPYRPYY